MSKGHGAWVYLFSLGIIKLIIYIYIECSSRLHHMKKEQRKSEVHSCGSQKMVASRLQPPFLNPLFSSNSYSSHPLPSPSRPTFLALSANPQETSEPAKDRQKVVRIAWEKLVRWSRSWRSKAKTDVLERTNKVPSLNPYNSSSFTLYHLLWLLHSAFFVGSVIGSAGLLSHILGLFFSVS